MIRALSRLLAAALLPLATMAAAPDLQSVVPDRAWGFAQQWSCRSADGAIVRETGVRDGAAITVSYDVERNGKHSSFEDRYVYNATQQRWHVDSGLGGVAGTALQWTGDAWTVDAPNANGGPRRMTDEVLPGGDFRRTFASLNGSRWVPYSVERCTAGEIPPPADACIAKQYPAATLEAGHIMSRPFYQPGATGTVLVIVSLDENSRIAGTRILRSPDPTLNQPALAATRASRFRTAIVNCKPIKADYIFSVDF